MNTKIHRLAWLAVVMMVGSVSSAWALDEIIRPYQSARGSGMGGLRITTGLYDENFFGNPARVTENPKSKFTLPDPMIEMGNKTFSTIGDLKGGGDTLGKLGDSAGSKNH